MAKPHEANSGPGASKQQAVGSGRGRMKEIFQFPSALPTHSLPPPFPLPKNPHFGETKLPDYRLPTTD